MKNIAELKRISIFVQKRENFIKNLFKSYSKKGNLTHLFRVAFFI